MNIHQKSILSKHDITYVPNVFALNTRSLAKPHALDCLYSDLVFYDIDYCFISETHFTQAHNDVEIKDYNIFRKNRLNRKGGGVAILVRSNFSADYLENLNNLNRNFEVCWVQIKNAAQPTICAVVYHPPNPKYNSDDLLVHLEQCIYIICNTSIQPIIIIAGDFNKLASKDIIDHTGLFPINDLPTRGNNNLDNIYVNAMIWAESRVIVTNVCTDHKAVLLLAHKNSNFTVRAKVKMTKYYRKHGKKQIDHYLLFLQSQNADVEFKTTNVADYNNACDDFIIKLYLLFDTFFPIRRITVTSTDPSFVNAGIKNLLRKKNNFMRKGRCYEATILSEKIRAMIINNNKCSFTNVQTRRDSRKAWSKVNEFLGKSQKYSGNADKKQTITADELNDYYANTSNDTQYIEPSPKHSASEYYEDAEFFESKDIYQYLTHLKHTACGPDQLPYWFLRISAYHIAKQITMMFNKSLLYSVYPSILKNSIISPIPKVKDPVACQDFRPISVTNVIARLFDKLMMKKYFYPMLTAKDSLTVLDNQHGFRPTGSCEGCLISLLDSLTNILSKKENKYAVVLSLDISKAFDCISHKSVFQALANFNIPDVVYNWSISYLTQRIHCTKYNDLYSNYKKINAGVVQGSGLGPLFFITAFADFKTYSDRNVSIMYADDSYIIVPSSNIQTLNAEIDQFKLWAAAKHLYINDNKTKLICYTYQKEKIVKPGQDLLICTGTNVKLVNEMKILGVITCSNFSFGEHVSSIVNKCNRIMYMLRIMKLYGTPPESCRDVFYALVVSNIAYCINAWFGYCKEQDKKRLRKILRRGYKCGYSTNEIHLEDIHNTRSTTLFYNILRNEHHVLRSLLPPLKSTNYNLRKSGYGLELPPIVFPHDTRNFILHMLFKIYI